MSVCLYVCSAGENSNKFGTNIMDYATKYALRIQLAVAKRVSDDTDHESLSSQISKEY